MKTQFITTALIALSFHFTLAQEEPSVFLKTINPDLALAAVASYSEGHFRFLQNGQLIESQEVDESLPSCMLETGKMKFDPAAAYKLESTRSLEVDGESGEIELNFQTLSDDPDSYFQIYCFQSEPGANIETARQGLKSIFTLD